MKTDLFQSCGHCWVFQICWHIECSTFTASSFRIWKSSTGIPSPPLALFVVMFSKAHLTSHSRKCGSRCVITSSWGTRDQIANICWIIEKAREFWKNIYFCFIDYAKAFDCVDHNKLWTILKEMGIPDHLTCLLKNLYAGQEATVRTEHGTTDWFQLGKGVRQGCILSPCLFNLYAEYIMRNTGLEEQAGIKIAGRNLNNLRYADDTTLMAESEEELRASWCMGKRRMKKLA